MTSFPITSAELAAAVHSLWTGKRIELDSRLCGSGPVYGELRKSGHLVSGLWEYGQDWWASLVELVQSLRLSTGNELLLCFGKPPRRVALGNEIEWKRIIANKQRGLYGYELLLTGRSDRVLRFAPFHLVAQNRTVEAMVQNFARQHGLSLREARAGGVELREFEADQFWMDWRKKSATRLFRGSRLVDLADISRSSLESLGRLLSGYLSQSVRPDGRMNYLYYPSRGCENETKNNAIRQWMATRALIQIWQRSKAVELLPLLHKNICFNLQTMYGEVAGLGLVFDGGKVKLGAVALAALALKESPFAKEFETAILRLCMTVDALWRASGEFHTFYRPATRNDCQNFYPGEALLLWSTVIRETKDFRLIGRFWKSFAFYQQWHQAHRNPAFIPWHTQAYWNFWKINQDIRLAQAIFNMNDWLLAVQQWESAPSPDCRGRFYDPHRPFGPPHASSTAVYLEGLADAFALAREMEEEHRANRYRLAIIRGLRNIAQLTFKDDADMFYVTKRDRLRGGVRTTEYNNAVRIDNVQHSLAAIHKVLDAFTDADFG